MRSSPGNCTSRPPFMKKVTCGYFSVSAMRSCFRPCSAKISPMVSLTSCGGNRAVMKRERGFEYCVIPAAAQNFGSAYAMETVECRIQQCGRDFARPVGSKICKQQCVAVADARVIADHTRKRRIHRLPRWHRIALIAFMGSPRHAPLRQRRSRRRLSPRVPSSCRDPSRNSDH